MTQVDFRGDLRLQKTRDPGPGVVCVILRLAVLVEHRLVIDGRTDGQTQGHGWYRGCIASHGKNGSRGLCVQFICTSSRREFLVSTPGCLLCCACVQAQALASQAEKRQRSFDKVIDEWKRKVADLQAELERSQRDSRAHAAEVYKLRSQLEESNDSTEALRRENKNLTGQSDAP